MSLIFWPASWYLVRLSREILASSSALTWTKVVCFLDCLASEMYLRLIWPHLLDESLHPGVVGEHLLVVDLVVDQGLHLV